MNLLPPSGPTADMDNPCHTRIAHQITDVGISAYLVALAAWQRGLQVTFHYEVASKCPRFAHLPVQGFRGELFSVSNGSTTHFFYRTLGDLTSRAASQLAENKQRSKECFRQHGVPTPAGVVLPAGPTKILQQTAMRKAKAFMQQHAGKTFVLKPLDGSLGEGVHLRLSRPQVLATLAKPQAKALLLEEFVLGRFYRVYVVGDRYINTFENRMSSVVGDGITTISGLVALKNQRRHHQPLYASRQLVITPHEITYLASQALTPESVPLAGVRVYLNDSVFGTHGSDRIDCTDTLPAAIREIAVKATQALGLPNAGLDILQEMRTGRVVVLEANQTAIITGNAFPMVGPSAGNRVAEAIIDHYFPESVTAARFTEATFDFPLLVKALRSGVASEITLPTLDKGWFHQRLRIPAESNTDPLLKVRTEQYRLGVHVQCWKAESGELQVDVLAPTLRGNAFAKAVGGRVISRLASTPPC